MSHDNPIDRGEPSLLLQEVGDSSDIASQEQTHEAGWDPDQLLDPARGLTFSQDAPLDSRSRAQVA